jgi:hypothetical protein
MKNTINLLLFFIFPCYLSAQKFDFKVGETKDLSKSISIFPRFHAANYYNLNSNEYVNEDSLKELPDTLNLYLRLTLSQNYKRHEKLLYLGSENTILILKLQDTMRKGEIYKLKCRVKLNNENTKLNSINFVLDSTNILLSNINILDGVEFSRSMRFELPSDTSDYYFKNRKTIGEFTNTYLVYPEMECCKWYDLESNIISLGGEYLLYFNTIGNPTTLRFKKDPLGNDDIRIDLDYIEITKINK